MILIAASMHFREHRTFSLRTPSIHVREEDPKDVVKSSICGIIMGILFMLIFAVIGLVGIFTNLDEHQYTWMLIVVTLTYILFIPYFIFILKDLRRISAELEKHQDEAVVANPYAFMSGMNTIIAITNTEKYNLFRLLNFQFFIISLILSALLINSKIVIGSLLAIVNYIIASTIVIYSCRKCWLSCCNIKVATKKPKRYHFYRYPSPLQVQHTTFLFGLFLMIYYIMKGAVYISFMTVQEGGDFKFTQLTSLFYSFIMVTQISYVVYLIKKINHTYYSKKYYKCYMTLFQSLYLSYTIQNCILKGLYLFSLLCCYVAFFLEKPYKTITTDHLFGIEQFCSYEHFIYMGIFLQLIYFLFFRSYCVSKEEEQLQIFDIKQQLQPHECRLQWLQQQNDYPIYKRQVSSIVYQITDLEALQEIYDNFVLPNQQQDLRIPSKGGQVIDLDQWIEDKRFQFQLEGKKMNQEYFTNLKQFIEENIGQKQKPQQKQIQDRMECAICLQNLEQKQNITQLECHFSHKFHSECIERWIQAVHKCPLCNKPA